MGRCIYGRKSTVTEELPGILAPYPPGPKSISILRKVQNSIARSNYAGLFGISMVDGKGPYVVDADGNTYIDCLGAASVNILGYKNSVLIKAVGKQMKEMHNEGLCYGPSSTAAELADLLIKITPGLHEKRVLFGLSGSSSIDGSIEAVRKYTGKFGIIHFKNAYHGSTGLSQQASHFGRLNDGIFPAYNRLFAHVDFPKSQEDARRVLNEVEILLKTNFYAGFVAEIYQGDAGVFLPPSGFFPKLLELLHQNNTYLIADEIQSGMGRIGGKWWACEHVGIIPDILVCGKGLAAGYACISAAIGNKDIIQALNPAQHLFSLCGHSVSARAAISCVDEIVDKKYLDLNAKTGDKLIEGFLAIQKEFPNAIKEVRGKGLMIGIEIINNYQNTKKLSGGCIFAARAVSLGVYFGYFGVHQEVVRVEPSYLLSKHNLDTILSVTRQVAHEFSTNSIPDIVISQLSLYSVGLNK